MSDSKTFEAIRGELKRIGDALQENNTVLERLVDFLTNAPEFREIEWGSAEDDKIDDSLQEVNEEEDAIKEIKEQWKEDGYSDLLVSG